MNSSRRKFALYLGPHLIGYAHAPETLPPTAYFCEECGNIWGRAISPARNEHWWIIPRRCPRHPLAANWWETAGSFLQGSWITIDDLDRDALIYEFELERTQNGT